MKVLITGGAGQLGAAMVRQLSPRHTLLVTTIEDLDICDAAAVKGAVTRARPDAIVNCAAYTDVDAAEDEPVKALRVNAFAVRTLAAAAATVNAALVHFSTDFVFDGETDVPYSEADAPNPRSTYACSKLIGEWFAREAPRHYVLRVESLFGGPADPGGTRRTSVDRIADAVLEGRQVRVFVDRTVSPSYTADVCRATEALLEQERPAGLYHCVNSGQCTWYDLAQEIGRQLGKTPDLLPVAVAAAGLRAQRPTFCALSNARLANAGIAMPSWQDAIARYLQIRAEMSR